MRFRQSHRLLGGAGLLGLLAACDANSNTPSPSSLPPTFTETDLVADAAGHGSAQVDAHLVNPWGVAINPTNGAIWVANNHTGTSTIYQPDGTVVPLVVDIPTATAATGGEPTGVVYNATTGFVIPGSDAATFIFASEDGTISAWSAATGAAKVVINRSDNSAYFGVAIIANTLFAANFKTKQVDIFDQTFAYVKSVTDANVPAEYGPLNVAAIGDQLYVAYAQRDPATGDEVAGAGNGFVSVFNSNGDFVKRFASNGNLNAPWAIVSAPSSFGTYANQILVGNFGDGHVNVFNASSGDFIAQLSMSDNTLLTIEGLWGLGVGSSGQLFFAAGINDEADGLFGTIGAN